MYNSSIPYPITASHKSHPNITRAQATQNNTRLEIILAQEPPEA